MIHQIHQFVNKHTLFKLEHTLSLIQVLMHDTVDGSPRRAPPDDEENVSKNMLVDFAKELFFSSASNNLDSGVMSDRIIIHHH